MPRIFPLSLSPPDNDKHTINRTRFYALPLTQSTTRKQHAKRQVPDEGTALFLQYLHMKS